MSPVAPPDRIVLKDLLLRRWTDDDAPALLGAVTESHEHLRPWMPWAAAPPTPDGQRAALGMFARGWESGETFAYGIFDPAETAILGTVGLHGRVGPGGLDIGYWVHAAHTRRGIATTGAAVMTEVAFGLPGIDRVEIHCDPANVASAAVPRRLGYVLDRTDDDMIDTPAKTGKRMIWIMTRDRFAGSEAERRARAAHGH